MSVPLTIEAPCCVSAGVYMKRAFAVWFFRRWWCIVAPLAVCVSLCSVDVKWSVIAFILCIFAMMMGLTLVYFNYAFSPQARWSIMEKTATIDGGGITFDFAHPKMKPHTVRWDDVKTMQFRPEGIVLSLSPSTFLMLPPQSPHSVEIIKKLYMNV